MLISLIMAVFLLIGALGFGGWAYSSRQDYKDHSDKKAQTAAELARQKESAAKDRQFAEEAKNPLKTYNGPAAYGSLTVNYPKTWSGYVDDTGSGAALVDGYFNPGVVPALNNQDSVFALRVQVLNQQYVSVLQTFSGLQQSGKVKVSAYALPKLPNVVGVRVTGQLTEKKTVDMVVLPLRAQTIEISTEGGQFGADFNTYILPNFSFSP